MEKVARNECITDYLIPVAIIDEVLDYLNKSINKSKGALSTRKIRYKCLGEEYKPVYDGENKRYYPLSCIRVRTVVSIGTQEWQLLGVLEKTNEGNRFTYLNGNLQTCPSFFRICDFDCAECGVIGNRKYLYIVQSMYNGWMQKVGGECLDSYTTSKMSSDIRFIQKFYKEMSLYENAPNGNPKKYYPVRMILRMSIQLVEKYGYIKDGGEKDTKQLVTRFLTDNSDRVVSELATMGLFAPYGRCPKELDDKVDKVLYRYSKPLESYKNDYEEMLYTTISKYRAVPFNKIGLISSAYRKSKS